ncbi:uncharacterized protein LOC109426857 [Aedes albopictus]|uniref:F-box domain-containing protein n=1 Tax=Aedes albopictus TaxID=7160 RepID=A0ABM1Z3A6_AEDAL
MWDQATFEPIHIPKMATINDLPNEILLAIFQQIEGKKHLTRICKLWNELIVNFLVLKISLLSEERIRKFAGMVFTRSYQQLSISGVMLVESDFNWTGCSRQLKNAPAKRARKETDPYVLLRKCLQVVRQYERTVRVMSLSFGPIMDKSLLAFLPRGDGPSSLECLVIEINNWHIMKEENWNVSRMEFIAEEGLQEISEMPKLKSLRFGDSRTKGDRTVRRKFFDAITRNAKAITSISLTSRSVTCYSDYRIVRSFSTQLQELTITVWPLFVKDFFQLSFPKVKILKLDFKCITIPDAAHLFQNLKSLIDLTVTSADNDEFLRQGVYRHATTVERLTISENRNITMDGLQGLIGLKELQLECECSWFEFDEQIAVPCSSSLEKLVIERCTNGIPFYGALVESVPHITELHITGDNTFNDGCLRAICTTMKNIRRLKLTLIPFVEDPITDVSLRYIGNLRKLEYLFLESYDDEDTIQLTGSGWVSLLWASDVHLNGFYEIDLPNMLDLLLNPNLRKLTLDQCGRACRIVETVGKLKQLMSDSRPLPHIAVMNMWQSARQ